MVQGTNKRRLNDPHHKQAKRDHSISPLAPRKFPKLPQIAGVQIATGAAGIKKKGRADVLFAIFEPGTQAAGVFTKSRTPSAPVDWCRAQLVHQTARALVANSGNANAFTGKAGRDSLGRVAQSAAVLAGCEAREVWLASTGVIGEPLPSEKIVRVLNKIAEDNSTSDWLAAASAIMTTDTYPKLATKIAKLDGYPVKINGIAKGSGMIAPDMATMLAFVFTDANLSGSVLQELLVAGTEKSFNSITVDSDTSTSDTLLLFATRKAKGHRKIINASDERLSDFRQKLDELLLDLALQVVKDGEGATKLIRIEVSGAESDAAARRIAFSIANSPRVKTAIGGGDPNWGRIVMAVGKSGEAADRDRLKITLGNCIVAEKGMRAATYDEAAAIRALSGREVTISVEVGQGWGSGHVWTCDLTANYVNLNCGYRH